jgi:hypothetical protein
MDPRIESITKDGTEFLADYVTSVTASSARFLENLLGNVATLVKGVVDDGFDVVSAAASAFAPESVLRDLAEGEEGKQGEQDEPDEPDKELEEDENGATETREENPET